MTGPLKVVTPGSNINTTNVSQLVTDTSIPFTKLDTQNIVSFQTISVLFNGEPSQPPSASQYATSLIYQFPHNYSYIPSIWMMWQNDSPEFPLPPANDMDTATTFYAFGDDTSTSLSSAVLSVNDSFTYLPTSELGTLAYVEYNDGIVLQTTTADLYVSVDASNVYLYILKVATNLISGSVIPIYLAGVTLNIRCYIFCEPGSTSSY